MSVLGNILSALSGSALALLIFHLFGRGWVETILDKKRAGYSKELAKLQAHYATELETIKAEVGRAIFVTNVHFETEFDALKRTFEAATALKQTFMALRPLFALVPEGEDEKRQILIENFKRCADAYNAFISVYENLSPFYPKEIYDNFHECRIAANVEMMQIELDRGIVKPGRYDEAIKNQDRFMTAYHAASELIRARIATLAVAGRRM